MLTAYFQKPNSLTDSDKDEVYQFWKSHWDMEFRSHNLSGISTTHSDDFLFSDELLVVRYDDEIAGLILISDFDRSKEFHRECSYFDGFPELPYVKVQALRYFLVKPKLRMRRYAMIGPMLVALCIKHFWETENELLIGMPLKHSRVHTMGVKFGFQSMTSGSGAVKHSVPVEYMCLRREDAKLALVERIISSHYKPSLDLLKSA